jgi:hypothetical protein
MAGSHRAKGRVKRAATLGTRGRHRASKATKKHGNSVKSTQARARGFWG